jgi:hypothetical protein
MIEGDRLYKRVTDDATRDPTLQLIVGGGLEQAIYNNVQLGFNVSVIRRPSGRIVEE